MRVTWAILLLLIIPLSSRTALQIDYVPEFSGPTAMSHLVTQCDFGPRPPGSYNLSLCRQYIVDTLEGHGWETMFQNFTEQDVSCANVIAWYGPSRNATMLLGAHYDTRPLADNDPDPTNQSKPVLGANDGASGTAVLLEMARVLPIEVRNDVELIFFDAEDSGGINGWNWIVGSTYYVNQLSPDQISSISSMILLDMVGDSELRLQRETYSTKSLQDMLWSLAADMGYSDIFQNSLGEAILDDHHPFLEVHIPALDIIHHNPFPSSWHTADDTPERCSSTSLQIVGEVVETFLVTQSGMNTTSPPDFPVFYYLLVLGAIGVAALLAFTRFKKR
ncbi:MAG: M28 family peptidase [Candidatus Thorarchaeota archaeon]